MAHRRVERKKTMKTLQNVEKETIQSGTRFGGISNAVFLTVCLSLLCVSPLSIFSDEIGGEPVDGLEGWFFSDWFGYYSTAVAPWLFHAEHGYLYRFPESTNANTYFYDNAMGAWWWTNETVYPFVYRFSDGVWLWYNLGTESWESL